MSQAETGASRSGHIVFPREFKRSGAEQIDWKLTGFGASMFVVAFSLIAMFASMEPPEISAEEVHKRAVRIVSQLEMPDIPEEVIEPEVEDVPEVEVVEAEAEAEPVPQAEAQPRVRERAPQASSGGGGGESRSERRRGRGNARAAAAAAIAQQGVWAQLSTGSSGTGAAVASGISGADLESNLGKVGGVKRGGTSTFTGEGDGTGSGEGAIVGPGGGRSTQGAGDAGMDVGSLLGSGGGVGGGGASSLGGDGDGVGGGVDIDVSAIADASGGASTEEARSSSAVLTVMRQNLGPIQFCYQRELKLNPKLQGKLALRLTIRANGRVQKVEVASDTVRNRNLSRCVQGRVRAWRFQPASGTTVVTITLPFSPSS